MYEWVLILSNPLPFWSLDSLSKTNELSRLCSYLNLMWKTAPVLSILCYR